MTEGGLIQSPESALFFRFLYFRMSASAISASPTAEHPN
jgi:hypothetical protein